MLTPAHTAATVVGLNKSTSVPGSRQSDPEETCGPDKKELLEVR